ncbi:hypothetical protein MTP99_003068 [Tenebrio molitor]|jgi:hypothetical protein|nr:hypothetical protein MTP99_003068 [Tenebrio molitor]
MTPGESVVPFGTAPGTEGRPVELPVQDRPVVGATAAWHSADLLAPVGLVDSASCKCWLEVGDSVWLQVFYVCSEDLLSGWGLDVIHQWREDFRDGERAGVFRG